MATNPEEQMSDFFYEIDDLLDFLNEEEEENALVMVKKPCNETGAFLLHPLTPPPPKPCNETGAFLLHPLTPPPPKPCNETGAFLLHPLTPPPPPPTASPGGGGVECSSNQKQFDEKLDYLTPALLDECDSFLADVEPPSAADGVAKIDAFVRDLSPISVLEPAANSSGDSSSSSPSHSLTSASHSCGRPFPARARSKRRRPAAFYLPSPPSHSVNESLGASESSPVPKKKLKIIIKSSAATAAAGTEEEESVSPGLRKCTHCGLQKTPQWRAGPTGPKTLCNACGVRYKTGRLFPEYRPAASPTFVPDLHSNSHKKVVEMRMKASSTAIGAGHDDGCDLLQLIRRPH